MNNEVYIVDAVRSPVGSPYRSLKLFSAAQTAGQVIKEVVRKNKLKKSGVDEVILGNTVSAGTGQNLARQATIIGGLPVTTPAYVVNRVCGAGMQSIISGVQSIACGNADIVIAGGTESATHNPNLFFDFEGDGGRQVKETDSLNYDGLWCMLTNRHMGELAEKVARSQKISREMQDQYSMQSHQRALDAKMSGKFQKEIHKIKSRKNKIFENDERIRPNVSIEKFIDLPPAFKKNGTITAGNASVPSDGAAMILLASKKAVKEMKLKPRAVFKGFSNIAVDPEDTFMASVPSIKQALQNTNLKIKDIALFEICEAFAVQSIYVKKKLKISSNIMNIWGGDLAIGHPLGAAGTRILVTLLHALEDQNLKTGLANICLGGGGSMSIIIER